MGADLITPESQSVEIELFQNGDLHKRLEEEIKVKIITQTDDFDAFEQEWTELVRESNTHVYQTYEWNRIWWKHFGTKKNLHIVALYKGNKLVAIAPLFEDDVTLFGRKVYSCLRFLGSYVSQPKGEPLLGTVSYSDYLDCIIHPGFEKIFYKLILKHFKEIKSEFDEIVFDEVSSKSAISKMMIPQMEKINYEWSYKIEQASSSPVIQLDSTWDAYLNSMNAKERYNVRRYYKRSIGNTKIFNIKKAEHAEELSGVVAEFIRMHQEQWNSRGLPGTFSEKRMHDFFIEVTKSFYDKDWMEFNLAVPVGEGKKIVAVDVLLTYKNRVYLMHRGMDENPRYRKQGPGNVLLYARLNEAIKDGVEVFDMLRGSEEFKLRMATKVNQNKKITIVSGSKKGRVFSGLVKRILKVVSEGRGEISHLKLVFNDKPLFEGLTDYKQFLLRRIEHRSKK